MMVELMAPGPDEVICDPACGTSGFLVAAGEYLEEIVENGYDLSINKYITSEKQSGKIL